MTDSDKIQTLPLPFLERMKEMLGDDYDAFLKSYKNPRTYGLRGSIPDTSTRRKAALHDVLTTRRAFIISRNQVP